MTRLTGAPAPLWRRVGALVYDGLFMLAILILATFVLLPFTHGQAVPATGPWSWLYRLYLLAWVGAYFSLFWCIGGQTPGMKVWHIAVSMPDSRRRACLGRGLLRFAGGLLSLLLFGLPFWWALGNDQRRSLVDRWLDTPVVRR